MPRRILEWNSMGRRIRGRPRKRWIEDVEEDMQTMGIRGWRKLSKERTEWKKIAEKACDANIRRRRPKINEYSWSCDPRFTSSPVRHVVQAVTIVS